MDKLISGYTTAAAFDLIEKTYPEVINTWNPSNENQRLLLNEVKSLKPYVDKFKDEIYNLVTTNPEEINEVLENNGFSGRLEKLLGTKDDMYFISLLMIEQPWVIKKLVASPIRIDNQSYRGFIFRKALYHNNFLRIELANGDDVFIYMSDEDDEDGFVREIELFKENRDSIDTCTYGSGRSGYSGPGIDPLPVPTFHNQLVDAHIPCVDMIIEKTLDVNGIKYGSLMPYDKYFKLIKGLFGQKFTMNAGGIEIKEYTALSGSSGTSGSSGPKTVKIDRPFFIAIQREGTPVPYFKTYVSKTNLIKQTKAYEI